MPCAFAQARNFRVVIAGLIGTGSLGLRGSRDVASAEWLWEEIDSSRSGHRKSPASLADCAKEAPQDGKVGNELWRHFGNSRVGPKSSVTRFPSSEYGVG